MKFLLGALIFVVVAVVLTDDFVTEPFCRIKDKNFPLFFLIPKWMVYVKIFRVGGRHDGFTIGTW